MISGVKLRALLVLAGVALSVWIGASEAAGVDPWPYWRGAASDGMAVGDAPLRWSDTENVRWMTEIPGRGNSSPIIVGDRIFLTTAVPTGKQAGPAPQGQMAKIGGGYGVSEHTFELLCLDRKTGKLIWRRTAKTATPHEGYHQAYGSFASNSPATDGKRIYAFFGSRGVYCYDLEGKLIWEKDFGVQMRMRMAFGEGMAAVVHGNRLILVFDHDAGDSFMAVLDTSSGKEIWRTSRDEKSSWAAPLVIEHGGKKQILVSATNKVRSYDFESGKVIWECAGLGANVIPAPVRQDDLVFVMSGFMNPNLMAIRLGREGDLTGTDAIAWSQTRGNSYTPSPVLHDNKLYVLTDNGMISCYNAKTGEPYYHQVRLPKSYSFKSSLVGANGKLYLSSENEDVIVLAMGEKYEVLATNTLTDQMFIATPAIADGKIYLRSQTRLYCIGEN
jgi:outer membrane protein assembly factor BamB